jgi:hypothetical protein
MKLFIQKHTKSEMKPTNYFWIGDMSGSMHGSIKDLKETLRAVKDLLIPGDTFSLAYFSSSRDFDWICKGATLTNNLDKLINDKVYARGLTCFTEVLASVENTVKDVVLLTGNKDNVFFFLTDGYPNDNSPEKEVIRLCKSLSKTFVHKQIVGYSNYYNRKLLLEMTETIGGAFSHVSDYKDMKKNCEEFVSGKKMVKTIDLPHNYDVIWQVTGNDVIPLVADGRKVDVLETDADGELFGVNFDEIDALKAEDLQDAKFAYSLALVLSQKNKANMGVSILRKAGASQAAKMLQKSFTVNQKGCAENNLKVLALSGGQVDKEKVSKTTPINDFLKSVKDKLGKASIDMKKSTYKSISRKGTDISKVEFDTSDTTAKIIGITGNEDRANISFLTVRKGQVTAINDDDLNTRIKAFNKSSKDKIILPIEGDTYRNYTLIANGDFNFDKLTLNFEDSEYTVYPSKDIDLFDENQKDIKIDEFVKLYKSLIEEKAHASALRFYIKANSSQKHMDDLRINRYGVEGAKLVEEMGFDYAMRFAPKKEYKAKDDNADYVPFLEITGQLKGASAISASKSYEKFTKKGKANAGDAILFPLFEKYDKKLVDLGKETFVEFCQKTLEGVEETVDYLSQKVSSMKFYLMITNSWFSGVEKSDEFEHDGLVIKTKETKEYL